jgi:hypothetical protein
MTAKRVLAIGLDPAFADFGAMPGLTPDLVRAHIAAQIEAVRALGYEVESCLVDAGETAEAAVERALKSARFDCVVIGAGLRLPPERVSLFEKIVNAVHVLAPRSRIAFNTSPGDTAEAVRRWVPPG